MTRKALKNEVHTNREEYNHYFEYWSSVKPGINILKQITGEEPPRVRGTCRLCSRDVKNIEPGDTTAFSNYLQRHSRKIYVALDELRLEEGGQAFPIFYGPASWRTEIGGSRKWRKPAILKNLNQQIDWLKKLKGFALNSAKAIDVLAETLKEQKAS